MSSQKAVRLGYRPELDGVRALAIVAVIAFHARHLRGGFAGVDLFFVLSGFLITSLLLDEWQSAGTIRLGAFYARRALRLLPALLAVLLALWIGLWLFRGRFHTDATLMAHTTLYTLAYVANWVLALRMASWPANLDHVWSLSIEEQFYLVWPALLLFLLWRRVPRRVMVGLLGLGIVACALWRADLWYRTHDFTRIYFATDTRADALLLGCLTSLVSRELAPSRWLGVLGLLCFAIGLWLWDDGTSAPYFGGFTIIGLSSALLVMAPPAWLSHRSLVWVGRRSYGIYIWHAPILYAVEHLPHPYPQLNTFLWISLSFVVAAVSHAYVETPALRLKKRLATRAAVVPVAAPALDVESDAAMLSSAGPDFASPAGSV